MSFSREAPPQPAPSNEPATAPPYLSPPGMTPEEAAKRSSRKAILIAVVLIVVVAGAGTFAYVYTQTNLLGSNTASTKPQTTYATYSKYGFSFQYPSTWTITEKGFPPATTPDTNSGIVLVENPSNANQVTLVGWIHTTNQGDPSTALSNAISGFNNGAGGSGLSTGQVSTTTHLGYTVYYESFSVTVSGSHLYGVWSVWYSTHAQRFYQLSVITPNSDSMSSFNTYLASFTEA